MTVDRLIAGIEARDTSALARAISLVENARDGFEALLSALHPRVGRAFRVGVTGPPGAGKSTLAERLIQSYRQRGHGVAVVAVDPTSPFSGGALLGDRIRMESAALDPNVFIRSMATRGAGGGLATTTREVCDVVDAYGFDRIIVETVGVGQAELAIAATADSAVLVLVPESGDGIQTLKAGVMEIADLYVVNKADRPGADKLRQEIDVMLGLRRGSAYRHMTPHHGRTAEREAGRSGESPSTAVEWEPPVLLTVATKGEGTEVLVDELERHREYLERSGEMERRRRVRLERLTREVVDRALRQLVWGNGLGEAALASGLEGVVQGRRSPYQLADDVVAAIRKEVRA